MVLARLLIKGGCLLMKRSRRNAREFDHTHILILLDFLSIMFLSLILPLSTPTPHKSKLWSSLLRCV